jgi:hypothetical protein
MSADTSDFDGLIRDLMKIPADMVPKIKDVVAKSALNTKKIMQADAKRSRHFGQLARTINYDLKTHGFAGDGVIEAEIGPSGGGAASLAGLAYFGSSKPGGGTVRNPEDAMLEEAPNFYEYAFKATEGLL